jgi:hypothetical protein
LKKLSLPFPVCNSNNKILYYIQTFWGAYFGECSKLRVGLIKEVSHEQRKKQAKTECKEKTTAQFERKKTSKERKNLFGIFRIIKIDRVEQFRNIPMNCRAT